ncbi:MAG: DNA mismatch repair protein MutS [Bacteroidia bacterium]|nr:DNA mismatch repair protein MutS [Bacteroidia bacterium]
MKQYKSIKAQYPDALLLFRVGDFYELFNEDAVKASSILGIVLTKRANGAATEMDLAGFPYHALDVYLPKLVRAGQRVAICDQLEDPKTAKSIVKRGVTELVSPGVAVSDKILDHKSNNFLAVIAGDEPLYGIALVDVSTGEFFVSEGTHDHIDRWLQQYQPSEVVMTKQMTHLFSSRFGSQYYIYGIDDWIFGQDYSYKKLLDHFETSSLKGFGIYTLTKGIQSAGAALHYLSEMQQNDLKQITRINRLDDVRYMWMDRFTIRNLELVSSVQPDAKTLIEILDHTLTPMGARLLRRWLLMPLRDKKQIVKRHEMVACLLNNLQAADEMRKYIRQIGDLERLITKVAMNKVSPREIVQLKKSLKALTPLKEAAISTGGPALISLAETLNDCHILTDKINQFLVDDSPSSSVKGGFIKSGVAKELDELRNVSISGKEHLSRLQQKEIESTGINSLKVGFNNVFGYYIEVTHTHKHKIPASWIRKQTLTNAERYVTEELKCYEEKILGAEEKMLALEGTLFAELLAFTQPYTEVIQANAFLVAQLDCLLSYAQSAYTNHYVCPEMSDECVTLIKGGRHPVLEKLMPAGESYIANDVTLDNNNQQILVITGPNMSGKSALLRQTALITIMAQAGSFVPADSAITGICDKVFTRVGASDNISSGESTFMVEMNETASILNNITPDSLVVLDEIGRGTSTYDGISIAWAIADYLHSNPQAKARTLFATHYHELNEMASSYTRIKNFHIAVKESDKRVIFLRKLVPGGSEHSFGIHVAKMSGMPSSVIEKAAQMLKLLEQAHSNSELIKEANHKKEKDTLQLSFFQLDDPALEKIRDELLKTDIHTLTPVEALLKLNDIKKLLG